MTRHPQDKQHQSLPQRLPPASVNMHPESVSSSPGRICLPLIFDGFSPCLCSFLHFPQGQPVLSQKTQIKSLFPPHQTDTCSFQLGVFTRTRLARARQTSHSTPEIYGWWKVELMFIFYQIAKRNAKWQIWVCLPGSAKAGIT